MHPTPWAPRDSMIERTLFIGFLKLWPATEKKQRTHHMLVRVTATLFRHAARLTPQCPVGPPPEAGTVSRLQRPPHVAIRKLVSHKRTPSRGFGLSIMLCKDRGTDPCPSRLPPSW